MPGCHVDGIRANQLDFQVAVLPANAVGVIVRNRLGFDRRIPERQGRAVPHDLPVAVAWGRLKRGDLAGIVRRGIRRGARRTVQPHAADVDVEFLRRLSGFKLYFYVFGIIQIGISCNINFLTRTIDGCALGIFPDKVIPANGRGVAGRRGFAAGQTDDVAVANGEAIAAAIFARNHATGGIDCAADYADVAGIGVNTIAAAIFARNRSARGLDMAVADDYATVPAVDAISVSVARAVRGGGGGGDFSVGYHDASLGLDAAAAAGSSHFAAV